MLVLPQIFRVEPTELDSSVIGLELPVDFGRLLIARRFPASHLTSEKLCGFDSSIEALSLQNTELAFCDVQPTPVLRRVVNLQTLGNGLRISPTNCFDASSKQMTGKRGSYGRA